MTASNRRYLMPLTPTPSAADLSGRLYVACNGSYLSIAGIMTDTQIYSPTGDLATGDSIEVLIDGRNDGLYRPRQDDHDLFFDPAGNAQDRDLAYPLKATVVAVVTPGSNWRFEANIPLTQVWRLIRKDSKIKVTFGLYDQDVAITTPTPGAPSGPSQVMIGPPKVWTAGVTEYGDPLESPEEPDDLTE